MKIGLDKAVHAFIGFMADQVAKIPKLGDRFLGFAALGSLKANPDTIINKVKPWGEMAGIVVDDKVDLGILEAALKEAFEAVPRVSYFGFSFTAEDSTALLKRMQPKEEA
jgi:hypothetical protein